MKCDTHSSTRRQRAVLVFSQLECPGHRLLSEKVLTQACSSLCSGGLGIVCNVLVTVGGVGGGLVTACLSSLTL